MDHSVILRDIKNRQLKPIYFLTGDEPFFADEILNALEKHVIPEEEKSFNQTILYGRDVSVEQVLESAKSFPMMSELQLVIIKEAKHLKDISKFVNYAANPVSSTVLVISFLGKKLDGRKKENKDLTTHIKKHGVYFESKKLYDNQLPEWINKYCSKRGIKIKPDASVLLAENLGNDLSKIVNELNKILINHKGEFITSKEIEEYIGISKDFNTFELQKALAQRKFDKAFQIAQYFQDNPKNHPMVMTIVTLFNFFSKVAILQMSTNKSKDFASRLLKINPFFFQDFQVASNNYPIKKTVEIISLLREYDLKSKGYGSVDTSNTLLKDLIFRIQN